MQIGFGLPQKSIQQTTSTTQIPLAAREENSEPSLFCTLEVKPLNSSITTTTSSDTTAIKKDIITELKDNIKEAEILSCEGFQFKFNQLDEVDQDNFITYFHGLIGEKRIKAMIYLGYIYNYVQKFKNVPQAIKCYSSTNENIIATYELGKIYEKQGKIDNAIENYYKAGLAKNLDAIYRLGILCGYQDNNNDTTKDDISKLKIINFWLKQLSSTLNTEEQAKDSYSNSLLFMEVACKLTQKLPIINNVAMIYRRKPNCMQKAIELLEYIAEKGHTIAIINLINCYKTEGETKDLQRAIYWAQQLSSGGLILIGNMYLTEPSIENITLALSYYEQSEIDIITKIEDIDSQLNILSQDVNQQSYPKRYKEELTFYLRQLYLSMGFLYLRQKSIQNLNKAILLFKKGFLTQYTGRYGHYPFIGPSNFETAYAEFLTSFHNTIIGSKIEKNTKIGQQFGIIITMLNIFAGVGAVRGFISGETLSTCVGNQQFLLPLLTAKCTDILYFPSQTDSLVNMGKQIFYSLTNLSEIKYDDSPYLKKEVISQELNTMIFTDSRYLSEAEILNFLLEYYYCQVDLDNIVLPKVIISGYKDPYNEKLITIIDISKINFNNCSNLHNITLKYVYLDLSQLNLFSAHNAALNSFTVSYNSIYEHLFQSYKTLFNDPESSFKVLPDDLKKLQLITILNEIIYDVGNKGGKIERLNEIKEWVNNIF